STHTVIAHEGYAFPHNVEYQKFKSLVDGIDSMIETVLHQNDNTTDNNYNNNTIPSNDGEPDRRFI
ncbi:MAG: hypothetical protein M3247_05955, partial [Thermoproteota archaeon]|nr:hypothetical protein [Thermoproteota archaeon]